MQGAGLGGGAFALFQDIGDIFTAVRLERQGVFQGACDLLRAVDFAPGDDFLEVVRAVEALVLQLAGISRGVRTQRQESQEQALRARLFALR